MSIANEINRIISARDDALEAIREKWVTVPSGANVESIFSLIRAIPTYFPGTKEVVYGTISGSYTNTRMTKVGDYAFAYCYSLEAVEMQRCISIGPYAFSSCSALASISFPACEHIGTYAFKNCSSLTSISFPACSYISLGAFEGCSNLISVNLTGSIFVSIDEYPFPSTSSDAFTTSGKIYVPASLVDQYKSATNWAYYSSQIVAYTE